MTTTYTPPASDLYGIVVVNDIGGIGSYTLGVGTCATPKVLQSGIARPMQNVQNYFEFDQQPHSWCAVGYRLTQSSPSLSVFGDPTGQPYPDCFGDPLGSDTGTQWEAALLVGDCTTGQSPTGDHYAYSPQYAEGASGMIEWDNGNQQLHVDATPITRSTGSQDVVSAWSVALIGGATYTFHFAPTGGAETKLFLFRTSGPDNWYDRTGAELVIGGGGHPQQYTAPADDWYGVVVVNDNGLAGAYTLSVDRCGLATPLEDGDIEITTPGWPSQDFSFLQQEGVWAAVGVRSSEDWNIAVKEHMSGGTPPSSCATGLLSQSTLPNDPQVVDFVVGDFHLNPLGDFHVNAYAGAGSGEGTVEWEFSPYPITHNGALRQFGTDADDVLRVYDVFMVEGHEYQIQFSRINGLADSRFLLFESSGETYWAPRSERVLESSTATTYTPTSTGYHGLVLVNDNGLFGIYEIGISAPTVSAGPGPNPPSSGILTLIPNPTRGAMQVQFELAEAGEVAFEIVDVKGRVVARIDPQELGAGVSVATWNGLTSRGTRPAAGVYFLRMTVGNEVAGGDRFVILR
jgi:hypothetical protein